MLKSLCKMAILSLSLGAANAAPITVDLVGEFSTDPSGLGANNAALLGGRFGGSVTYDAAALPEFTLPALFLSYSVLAFEFDFFTAANVLDHSISSGPQRTALTLDRGGGPAGDLFLNFQISSAVPYELLLLRFDLSGLGIDYDYSSFSETEMAFALSTTTTTFTFGYHSTDFTEPTERYADVLRVGGSVRGAAVPEPASYALMLLGVATLGAAQRRKRRA
jgi:hypothetical protein